MKLEPRKKAPQGMENLYTDDEGIEGSDKDTISISSMDAREDFNYYWVQEILNSVADGHKICHKGYQRLSVKFQGLLPLTALSVLANLSVPIKPETKTEDDYTVISGTLHEQIIAAKLQTHPEEELYGLQLMKLLADGTTQSAHIIQISQENTT